MSVIEKLEVMEKADVLEQGWTAAEEDMADVRRVCEMICNAAAIRICPECGPADFGELMGKVVVLSAVIE